MSAGCWPLRGGDDSSHGAQRTAANQTRSCAWSCVAQNAKKARHAGPARSRPGVPGISVWEVESADAGVVVRDQTDRSGSPSRPTSSIRKGAPRKIPVRNPFYATGTLAIGFYELLYRVPRILKWDEQPDRQRRA